MTLIVNETAEYIDPSGPVVIADGDDLLIASDPVSRTAGLGREAIGFEIGGFGRMLANNANFRIAHNHP